MHLEMDTNPNETREVNHKTCSEATDKDFLYSWAICCEFMKTRMLFGCINLATTQEEYGVAVGTEITMYDPKIKLTPWKSEGNLKSQG